MVANTYPNDENYPLPSFQTPITAPDVDPDEGAVVIIGLNPEWIPIVEGALDQGMLPSTWLGDHDAKILALNRWDNLKALFGSATVGEVGAPYWDDETADDADDLAPVDDQPWFGQVVIIDDELTFVENLGVWLIAAFGMYAGQPGAAIAFIPFARKFIVTAKKHGLGGIIKMFVDGEVVAVMDTYSPSDGVVSQTVVMPDPPMGFIAEDAPSVLWLVMSDEVNPAVDGDPTIELIKKRLWEGEVVPVNMRYNIDTDQIERTNDGGATWVADPGSDPRHNDAYRMPARTGSDPQCDAAANMRKWFRDFVESVTQLLEVGALAFVVINEILRFIDLLFEGAILLSAITEAAELLLGIGSAALEGAFDEGTYDTLMCIFYCRADGDGQVDAAAFDHIRNDIDAQLNTTAAIVTNFILGIQGEVGLSNAGAIGSETADCSTCICLTWPRQFNFCDDLDTWAITCGTLTLAGIASVNSCEGSPSIIYITRNIAIPAGSAITEIWWWVEGSPSTGDQADLYWNGSLITNLVNPTFREPFVTNGFSLTGTADMLIIWQRSTTGSDNRIPTVRLYGTGTPPDIGHDETDPPCL